MNWTLLSIDSNLKNIITILILFMKYVSLSVNVYVYDIKTVKTWNTM